jgi:hypothetical protein
MKQALVRTSIELLSSLLLCVNVWADEQINLSLSFSYGAKHLLPSLIANSDLEFDRKMSYSDVWIKSGFQISDNLRYDGALELTDQPHDLIGAKFKRLVYPLSTGRFQQSVVEYESNRLTVIVGRADMLSGELRPTLFSLPVSGDGFGWNYRFSDWDFKHVFQVLPAETYNNEVFRRSISYHHLSKKISDVTFGAGEYFILSGREIGFDIKRLNPFLPYSLNSHDSEADYFSGFFGDSDNSLIIFFLEWSEKSSKIGLNIYIDEFQVDADDRELYSDAMLFSLSAENEMNAFGQRSLLKWGFSLANPNFGQHPGPFTASTIGAFPLFEYTPGMKSLYFFKAQLFTERRYQISVSGYSERWLNIKHLSPDKTSLRAELNRLEVNTDSRFSVQSQYKFEKIPLSLSGLGWFEINEENNSGVKLDIRLNWKNSSKP